jgi:(1->4)-alpha-D-glucan 1-alpha-D-glucosylmutase
MPDMTRVPTSTYRIQFTPEFGFREVIDLIPYLEKLGISHIYASPLLKPVSGSEHGYDVVDPASFNPELGEESDVQEMLGELSNRGMGLILDIVPNHMAVNSANEWWQDVLEHGQRSAFAHYFDIDWERGGGKVVLPTLGDHFGAVLERGELRLDIDDRGLAIFYYENRFPVDPASYKQVLVEVRASFQQAAGERGSAAASELSAVIDLSREIDVQAGHRREIEQAASGIGRRVWNLYRQEEDILRAFDSVLASFNGEQGDPGSFSQLERLLDVQQYRLTYWRRASEEINYRRFFDIGDLISLRIEEPDVFDAVHALILEYAGTDGLDGFRADHVDGLYDPQAYAERLHQRLGEMSDDQADYLLLFEKILTGDERLPAKWPISGTTGYEFAHRVNAILAEPDGFDSIERTYVELTGLNRGFEAIVHENKANVLDDLFIGQFTMLVDELYASARRSRAYRDLSRVQLFAALRQVMIELPIYRTYVDDQGVSSRDRAVLISTLESARSACGDVEDLTWIFLEDVFTGDRESEQAAVFRAWVRRWQQFTGPLMAKGLEDTALYVYTPLSSLNEVGGEPETLSPDEFHAHNAHVAAHWPASMLTTSTHDTKRSEDVRARIAVLSELPDEWIDHLNRWVAANSDHKEHVGGIEVPDSNEEQLIYQTLLGAWPLDRAEFPEFRERMKQYLIKAMREAKVHTHWIAINEDHEQAVLRFIDRLFDADPGGEFFRSFLAFQTRISSYGAWNSLSQLTLKATSPGFPDIYQGNELWDFSLADPDNRRAVDFDLRQRYVEQVSAISSTELSGLVEQWRDARIKMLVTERILRSRREASEPFLSGEYLSLEVRGTHRDNVVAFARRSNDLWSVTVVPRLTTRLVAPEVAPVGADVWENTFIVLPDNAPSTWVDIVTGENLEIANRAEVRVGTVLKRVPVAVLRSV